MILVDTSVWIDHLHRSDPALVELLDQSEVAQHPMVLGELALGGLRDRGGVLDALGGLPSVEVAEHGEVMHFIEQRQLYGKGLSLVDVHLLACVLITPGAFLWTRDKRLRTAATDLGVAYGPTG